MKLGDGAFRTYVLAYLARERRTSIRVYFISLDI